MKLITFIFVLVGVLQAKAQLQTEEPSTEVFIASYNWLYEEIMHPDDKTANPSQAKKSFSVHLEDSNQKYIHLSDIKNSNYKGYKKAKGTITYIIIPKKYEYDLSIGSVKELVINVRVHFKNPNANDIANFTTKLKLAEDLWNQSKVPFYFNYRFKFDIVKDPKTAMFSVEILDKTRGPYDAYWSRSWSYRTIAHEMGHMLGLGDEYETLTGESYCLPDSIMCNSNGRIQLHHYYFILRRLFI